jgi:hypothetical protein
MWTDLYNEGTIFDLAEWHDSFLFQHLLNDFKDAGGFRSASISEPDPGTPGVHVFINSPLGQYMDHLKGDRKATGKSKKSDLYVIRKEDYWKKVK